jgi:hypothetical protein
MGQEKENGSEGTDNLCPVWTPGEFSTGVSDRGPEGSVQVPAMPDRARAGKAGHGKRARRKKAPGRRLKTCEVCRRTFEPDSVDSWRKQCEDCYYALREARLKCPHCENHFPQRLLVKVVITIQPGTAGSKKLSLYYCQPCVMVVKAKSTKLVVAQAKELKQLRAEQRKRMRE